MRLKTFSIVFIFMIMIVFGASLPVYLQLRTIQDIRLDTLEDRLYAENTEILSWAMKTIDKDALQDNPLPKSWGEIMLVDNAGLTITSSTNKEHAGLLLYKIPEMLDQASGIIDAVKNRKSFRTASDAYMIAVVPSGETTSLIGFKPKSWERSILAEQNSQLGMNMDSANTMMIVSVAAGLGLAIIAALVISLVVTSPTRKIVAAFEQLSIGNFDAEIPNRGSRVYGSLAESYFRLRTSLMMALERLGGK